MKILLYIFCGIVLLFVGGCVLIVAPLNSPGSGRLPMFLVVPLVANAAFIALAIWSTRPAGIAMIVIAPLYLLLFAATLAEEGGMGGFYAAVMALATVKVLIVLAVGYRMFKGPSSAA
jgi:hypothetical protein